MVLHSVEDGNAIIYGLESPSRSLTSHSNQLNNDNSVRFLVGTQSLKNENQIHVIEYLEETNSLAKSLFKHAAGEVWNISSSQKNLNLFTTCYSSKSPSHDTRIENHCSIWKFPVDMAEPLLDGDSVSTEPIELLSNLDGSTNTGRTCIWHPEDGNQIMTHDMGCLYLWDVESHKLISSFTFDPSAGGLTKGISKLSKITTFKWSPHFNSGIIGVALGGSIYAKDIRQKSTSTNFAWSINNSHSQMVRDLDFNPNVQHYLASCGDDCESRFWDIRNTSSPAISMLNHSHWVWSIRYNPFHDQLVLSGSSDSRVILTKISTLASQPFGHEESQDKEDQPPDSEEAIEFKASKNIDGIVATFEEHEDSVYSVEWSDSDPWVFASLSYDGRVVINKVPKNEKLSILF